MGKSLATQALGRVGKDWSKSSLTREANLQHTVAFANFVESRFGLENIQNLKPGHVQQYVRDMQERGLSTGTIANHMSAIRGLAQAIGKQNIVERENKAYGIVRDRYKPMTQNTDVVASIRAELEERAAVGDRVARMLCAAAQMREAFGLRAKESLLSHAVVNGQLQVEGAKGGRERELPVNSEAHFAAVARVEATARSLGNANGRIIPPEISLKQAYSTQRDTWSRLGGTRTEGCSMHASRHGYAQNRLAEGASRRQVAEELGHGREEVVKHYAQ